MMKRFNLGYLIVEKGRHQLDKLNEALCSSKTTKRSNKGFSSIGMTNVYERLQLSYRVSPGMVIESDPNVGTTVTIKIPLGGEGDVQSHVS